MSGDLNQTVHGQKFVDQDTFYRALIKGKYNKAGTKAVPRAFNDDRDGSGPSVDWASLSSPEETAGRLPNTKDQDKPIKVASISAKSIWECSLDIKHDPLPENHAHCQILGDKGQVDFAGDEARFRLAQATTIIYTAD